MCSLTYKLDRLISNSDGIDNFCKVHQILLVRAGIAKKLGLRRDQLYIVSLAVVLSQVTRSLRLSMLEDVFFEDFM